MDKISQYKYPQFWAGCYAQYCASVDQRRGTLLLTDHSGRQNSGRLTNIPNPANSWSTSGGRVALQFNGSSQYVDLIRANFLKLFPLSSYTISIWFTATFGRNNGLFGGLDSGSRLAVWLDSSNTIYFDTLSSTVGTERLPVSGLTWTDGKLYNVVASSGGGTGMRLYRDGVQVGSNSGNPVITTPTIPFALGSVRPGTFDLLGSILSCGLYGRTFTNSEVQLLYNVGPDAVLATKRQLRGRVATVPATRSRNYLVGAY